MRTATACTPMWSRRQARCSKRCRTRDGIATLKFPGQVAQLVEQRTENPRVGGSIPSLATTLTHSRHVLYRLLFGCVPVLYRENRLHHLRKPALPALRPLCIMLSN